ncbi:MAG: hypothetical protein VKK07_07675 [Merismopediaceae bacterium]|nr:hypothetical protein [Merismopediaceae bacterium]
MSHLQPNINGDPAPPADSPRAIAVRCYPINGLREPRTPEKASIPR